MDFLHTGAIGVQAPSGVDYSSASGVFLTDTGAVPEPATWAVMILGFGLAGGTLRRRRAIVA
ncbi:MAG: PEP-CTERM sorting domain-containing protein [Phenylobacterium sp.]|nr:PEP-CTERM sorting domain-containing protein [Phenylobacterium sp.]